MDTDVGDFSSFDELKKTVFLGKMVNGCNPGVAMEELNVDEQQIMEWMEQDDHFRGILQRTPAWYYREDSAQVDMVIRKQQ
jgi:hypothetical protein